MAKCVVCTALNSGVESNKHPNATTATMTRLLEKRWNDTPKRDAKHYCVLHSDTGTGRATGPFVKFAQEKLDAMKAAAEL